ncbi:MAG: hypothetical protein ABI868_23185 [Acidobacteriota bacterium]
MKPHELARAFESVAVHDTVVKPAGKLEPLGIEQTSDTGAVPPAAVGAGYVTATGESAVVSVTAAGQMIFGGSAGAIGVGVTGEVHPAAIQTPRRRTTGTDLQPRNTPNLVWV